MAHRSVWFVLLSAVLALPATATGCDKGSSSENEDALEAKKQDSPAPKQDGSAAKQDGSTASSDGDAKEAPEKEASPHWKDIPDIPSEAATRPAADAFASAPAVNTAPADRRPAHCDMKLAGQWLQIDCHESVMLSTREFDWGQTGKDYVDGSPLYLRLRPGTAQRGHLSPYNKPAVLLSVAWPKGDPKPWMIALEDKSQVARNKMAVQQQATPITEIAWKANQPRPAEPDWVRAKPINTAAEADRPNGCTMQALNGWLRLNCVGKGTLVDLRLLEGFGKAGKDYFRRSAFAGQGVELELPLRPGQGYKAYITDDFEHRATLMIEWPKDADKPAAVSLSKKK